MKRIFKFFKRIKEDKLPLGHFEGPKYSLRKDNHNGYHMHILVRKSANYLQSDYAITIVGNVVMAFHHSKSNNSAVHFNQSTLHSKKFLKEIEPVVKAKVGKIPQDEWRKFDRTRLVPLFHL